MAGGGGTRAEQRKADGSGPGSVFETSTSTRYFLDRAFAVLVFVATLFGLVVLGVLLVDIAQDGLPRLSWDFVRGFPASDAESSGIWPALLGSVWLLGITALVSVPLGIGAAIYLEEYATDNWLTRIVEINISNLAGVPSIIYGLLGLGLFVEFMRPLTGGQSLVSGGLTLSLLILPVIIITSREALRAIPNSVREGGYALGATKWEIIRSHLLPMAIPGIVTGTILALSRAIGEAAPLIVVGASLYITFTPLGPRDQYGALPIQIYDWIGRPQEEFKLLAAAGIVVLMVVLILTNSFAIWLRNRQQRRA
jgi:phosphate transport system permease protein